MKRKVVMWHGYSANLFDDLIKLCGCETSDNLEGSLDDHRVLYFEGTLDEFAARWKRNMLVYSDGSIYVTQHSNFGQR